MRFLLALTRGIIGLATSLHISNLRGAVYLDDRKVSKAVRRTDNAKIARDAAHAAHSDAMYLEAKITGSNVAFRTAAQAEVSGLRRGVFI